MQALAGVLPQKKNLRILNLRENELEDVGAIWLAKAISTLEKLENLDLTQNQVSRLIPQPQHPLWPYLTCRHSAIQAPVAVQTLFDNHFATVSLTTLTIKLESSP